MTENSLPSQKKAKKDREGTRGLLDSVDCLCHLEIFDVNLARLDTKMHVAFGDSKFNEILLHRSQHWFGTAYEVEQVLVIFRKYARHQIRCDVTGVGIVFAQWFFKYSEEL